MSRTLQRLGNFIHHHMLWFLLGAYGLAAALPLLGSVMRTVRVGSASLPQLMLAWLLFNAGAGISMDKVRSWKTKISLVTLGIAANTLIPLVYIFLLSLGSVIWPEQDEVRIILIGLVLSAAMPVAGSSTAWSQNVGGNPLVSLAMVLFSTLASPLITPVTLYLARLFVSKEVATALASVNFEESMIFLATTVVVPSALGLSFRAAVGESAWSKLFPYFRLTNLLNLLLLNYSNAASALPQAFANPDWDFLSIVLGVVSLQCAFAFFVGWKISAKAELGDRTALMYGLGMTNNGTGLVLASMHLSAFPLVALPLILANLVQQVAAGFVGYFIEKRLLPAET